MSRWLFAVVVNAWVANAADSPARAPSMPVVKTVVPVDWKYSSSAYDPIAVKWALYQMGYIGPGIRLPMTPLADHFHQPVLDALKSMGLLDEKA